MKYIASFSGGKDSVATILLARLHNEPLDEIIFSEVMYDKNTSGELPEHIDFIKNRCKPLFESWGYKFSILHSDTTYLDCFYHVVTRSKNTSRNGMISGFPMSGRCVINSACKVKPIKQYYKNIHCDYIQYLGIAIDETQRLERIHNDYTKVSLLEKYNFTENMAMDLCKQFDLLSPLYNITSRGGCWFCPNSRYSQLKHLRYDYPELWNKLLLLENVPNKVGDVWNTLNRVSISDYESSFTFDDSQLTIFDIVSPLN